MKAHLDGVYSVTFSPDGKTIASGGWDGKVALWDASTGRNIQTITKSKPSIVISVGFSGDGKLVAATGLDASVNVWNASNGETFKSYEIDTRSSGSIAISRDLESIAFAAEVRGRRAVRVMDGEPFAKQRGDFMGKAQGYPIGAFDARLLQQHDLTIADGGAH